MVYIQGKDRRQLQVTCLDDMVDNDSIVRVIDCFIDRLDLCELGFETRGDRATGRIPYSPELLAKILVFGYTEDIRSSRRLERACHNNTEMMWLAQGLAPDHKTLANFRRDNSEAIQALFEEFGSFTQYAGLIGKKVLALDGTKMRASNSKKRMLTQKKLRRQIRHHEKRVGEYLDALACADDEERADEAKIEAAHHRQRAQEAKTQLDALEDAGTGELGRTDGDAHNMGDRTTGVHPCYNVQAMADAQAHIVVSFDVKTTADDHGHIAQMAEAASTALRTTNITTVADKGYWGHADIQACQQKGLDVVIAPQGKAHSLDGTQISLDSFRYLDATESYICPGGNVLSSHSRRETKVRRFYNREACATCRLAHECLSGKKRYRTIYRQPYSAILEEAARHYEENLDTYALRQQTIEHVFGTIKRSMGADHFLMRGMRNVRCEAALLFLAYNVKRATNALGFEGMMTALEGYFSLLAKHGIPGLMHLSAVVLAFIWPKRAAVSVPG
ncbi:MAG: IS1182 family transposase [Coriobacteriales bacterium]|jgi:transposase|nr:IS1182 family transposase [Coriobacteriales bacterium]